MHLTRKIITAAGAITLTAGGIAAAASPPDAADKGLSTAEEQVGVELPATKDAHPGSQAPETETNEAPETEAPETEGEGQGPVDNHGAVVSAVAQTEFETGREHGEAVSAAARDNHGAEVRAEKGVGGGNAGEHGKP